MSGGLEGGYQTPVPSLILIEICMLFGRTYRCLAGRCKKRRPRTEIIMYRKRWECKVVLPDAKSLFHTLHIKVNTTQLSTNRFCHAYMYW